MRSPQVVGKLSPHEPVMRHKVTRGYAYVKADASGLAVPPEAAEEPATPESPEPAPPSAERPPRPTRTGPSIFDPY